MSRRPAEPPPCLSAPPAALDRPVQPAARSAWPERALPGWEPQPPAYGDPPGPTSAVRPDRRRRIRSSRRAHLRPRSRGRGRSGSRAAARPGSSRAPRPAVRGHSPWALRRGRPWALRRARPDAGSPCAVRPDCHARSRPHGISAPCSGTHPESRRVLRRWDPRPHPLTCRAAPRDAIPLRRRATAAGHGQPAASSGMPRSFSSRPEPDPPSGPPANPGRDEPCSPEGP